MSVIILLLAVSLLISGLFLGAFIWSIRHEQYEDEYSPPRRILFEDGSSESGVETLREDHHKIPLTNRQEHFN
jgi:cbb3-type cytochrome oxidase maturation protein